MPELQKFVNTTKLQVSRRASEVMIMSRAEFEKYIKHEFHIDASKFTSEATASMWGLWQAAILSERERIIGVIKATLENQLLAQALEAAIRRSGTGAE